MERSSQLLPSGADGKSINQIGQNFGKGSADMKGSVWNTDQPMNHDDRVGHRALSMQWSDPLTNRVLTCWDSGKYFNFSDYEALMIFIIIYLDMSDLG